MLVLLMLSRYLHTLFRIMAKIHPGIFVDPPELGEQSFLRLENGAQECRRFLEEGYPV